jgi:hypothetical protein
MITGPSLWRNRLEALTADQKVWGSTQQSEAIFSVHLNTRLFWWFRVVSSLLLHQLVRWCQYNVTSRP